MKVSAIIPAAGSGLRFGQAKQFKLFAGASLLYYSLKSFMECDAIGEIVLIVSENKFEEIKREASLRPSKKLVKVIIGGERRQDSVKNGILATRSDADLVCIHDAARPFVTLSLINQSINACKTADGGVVGIKSPDTVKYSENSLIKKTINRDNIWLAQTPQTFKKEKLTKAIIDAEKNNITCTDESSLMERMGFSILLVRGHINNFKITSQDDWDRAETLL